MRKLLLILITAFLTACAGSDSAPYSEDKIAKQFQIPTDGTANLYIYRDSSWGVSLGIDIYVNGQYIATTGADSYAYLSKLKPGKYKIESYLSVSDWKSWITVDLQPNTNTYIWQDLKLGQKVYLREVTERVGKIGVKEGRLLLH
ncbi:DUF2846 domain-containing protein [Ursidibacter arcticus]